MQQHELDYTSAVGELYVFSLGPYFDIMHAKSIIGLPKFIQPDALEMLANKYEI
jgi:hypothetical protein